MEEQLGEHHPGELRRERAPAQALYKHPANQLIAGMQVQPSEQLAEGTRRSPSE